MTSQVELRATLNERTTGDLISILRDRDEDEWRPEVFPIVEALLKERGIDPVSPGPTQRDSVNVVEDRALVTVAEYFSPAGAHILRSALDSAGIEAWVADENTGSTYGGVVGTRVRVREEDAGAAHDLLQALEEAPPVLPPDLAAPACPKCGALGARQSSELVEGSAQAETNRGLHWCWFYDCVECKHRWRDDGN